MHYRHCLAGCAVLLLLSRPAQAQSGCTNSGLQVVSDAQGDGSGSGDPQVDVLDVRMSEAGVGPFAGHLIVRLRVVQLDPPGSGLWTVSWKGPGTGQTGLSMTKCGSSGAPAFSCSFSDSNGNSASGAPDSAGFTAEGVITFILAPDQIGNPVRGDVLHDITVSATSFREAGGTCVPLLVGSTDAAGTGSYAMGACLLSAPDDRLARVRVGPAIPNPARAGLHFTMEVPADLAGEPLDAAFYDLAGRQIRSVLAGPAPAGFTGLAWDLRDATGIRVHAGTYWLHLRIGATTVTRSVRVVD